MSGLSFRSFSSCWEPRVDFKVTVCMCVWVMWAAAVTVGQWRRVRLEESSG